MARLSTPSRGWTLIEDGSPYERHFLATMRLMDPRYRAIDQDWLAEWREQNNGDNHYLAELWRWGNSANPAEIVMATLSLIEGPAASPTSRNEIYVAMLGIDYRHIARGEWNENVQFWFRQVYAQIRSLSSDHRVKCQIPDSMGWMPIGNVHRRIYFDERIEIERERNRRDAVFVEMRLFPD